MKKILFLLLFTPLIVSSQINWGASKKITEYTNEDKLRDSLDFIYMMSMRYVKDTIIYQVYDVILTVRDSSKKAVKSYYDPVTDRVKQDSVPFVTILEKRGTLVVTREYTNARVNFMTTKYKFFIGLWQVPFDWIESVTYIPKPISRL